MHKETYVTMGNDNYQNTRMNEQSIVITHYVMYF